ncbi:MAG TPA: VOC family protein [Cytophagaceae bacterium]|jgi:predicted 3-demethylubiquinone-9 3-methyltransferase (glyoxalase superfamily)|nr:VOC family protein [Cytophagaceae bacterium]
MNQNKIVPCLWFHTEGGNISKVNEYYKNVFGDDFKNGSIIPLGETPSGKTEMCEVYIFDQKYTFMSTADLHHSFNDAFAFAINCKDQNEIDKYWNYFTQEGKEVQCGWCIDKFGLRWQVLPQNMGTLMSKPNSFEVMMKQKKIIIEEYLQ